MEIGELEPDLQAGVIYINMAFLFSEETYQTCSKTSVNDIFFWGRNWRLKTVNPVYITQTGPIYGRVLPKGPVYMMKHKA
jgi:hypothetical protein